jgi:hypothetical protein
VQYHNVVGDIQPWYPTFGLKIPESDGVVRLTSAEADWAESQVSVPTKHSNVHTHPEAILEVRRILLDSLDETEQPQTAETVPSDVPGAMTQEPMRQVAVPRMLMPYFLRRPLPQPNDIQ